MRKRNWIVRGMKFAIVAALAVTAMSFAVMYLWNWLAPAVFGWHEVSFVQALGLLVLSRILFGGLRRGVGRQMHWRRRMMERWEQMTPEEREKFRNGMQHRCGHPRSAQPAQ